MSAPAHPPSHGRAVPPRTRCRAERSARASTGGSGTAPPARVQEAEQGGTRVPEHRAGFVRLDNGTRELRSSHFSKRDIVVCMDTGHVISPAVAGPTTSGEPACAQREARRAEGGAEPALRAGRPSRTFAAGRGRWWGRRGAGAPARRAGRLERWIGPAGAAARMVTVHSRAPSLPRPSSAASNALQSRPERAPALRGLALGPSAGQGGAEAGGGAPEHRADVFRLDYGAREALRHFTKRDVVVCTDMYTRARHHPQRRTLRMLVQVPQDCQETKGMVWAARDGPLQLAPVEGGGGGGEGSEPAAPGRTAD